MNQLDAVWSIWLTNDHMSSRSMESSGLEVETKPRYMSKLHTEHTRFLFPFL